MIHSSQYELLLGMSLDELNSRLNDTTKWKPLTPGLLDKWMKESKEEKKSSTN